MLVAQLKTGLGGVALGSRGVQSRLLEDGRQEWFITAFDPADMLLSGPLQHYALRACLVEMKAMGLKDDPGTDVADLIRTNHDVISARSADIAHSLLDELRSRTGPIDLVADFAMPHARQVYAAMMDLPMERVRQLQDWADLQFAADTGVAFQALRELLQFVSPLIAERSAGGTDLVSRYIAASRDLPPSQLVRGVTSMLLDGSWFISDHVVVSGVDRLLSNSTALEQLRQTPEDMPLAVTETLRLFDPTNAVSEEHGWCYRVPETITLADAVINVGDEVYVDIPVVARDAAVFRDPERFDPWRSDARRLPWVEDNAMCPSMQMMTLNSQEALSALVAQCPQLALAVPRQELQSRGHPRGGFVEFPVHFG